MSRKPIGCKPYHRGFPRVSGDEPETIHGNGAQFMFSPRERG